MEILECDLTFQDVLGIGTVTSHGKLLGLHLPCCRQQQKDLFTLKTGEVHKAVFPLPNILVRMHIWAAASLKLQVFFFLHFPYSFYLKHFHILILLSDANTLQAVDQFVRLQGLA